MEEKWLWWIIGVIVCTWFGFAAGIIIWWEPDGAGEFGDGLGALNSLFSGLAFAILIFTVALQKKELELQREELALTRLELQKSAKAQNEIAELNRAMLREQSKSELKCVEVSLVMSRNTINMKFKVLYNSLRIIKIDRKGAEDLIDIIESGPSYEELMEANSSFELELTSNDTKSIENRHFGLVFRYETSAGDRFKQTIHISGIRHKSDRQVPDADSMRA